MEIGNDKRMWLDLAASVLIRALGIGIVLLLLWFVIILSATDAIVRAHGPLFSITKEQFLLINYAGMGLFKLLIFLVFLIPYLAIRWTLRSVAKS